MLQTNDVPTISPATGFAGCLAAARQGSRHALGQLWEHSRRYLTAIANDELSRDLQAKYDGADLVQETFIEAQRDFSRFRGSRPDELRGWLRQILHNNLQNVRRHYTGTAKRNLQREVPLGDAVPSTDPTPSRFVMAQEQADALRQALEHLPDDYLRVIVLRQREQMTFEQIGETMERSAEAVRKLWVRAIALLQAKLTADDSATRPMS